VSAVSTVTVPEPTTGAPITSSGYWTRGRKAGAVYLVLGLLASAAFGTLATSGLDARFTLTEDANGAHVTIPAKGGAIGFGLLCAVAGVALLVGLGQRELTARPKARPVQRFFGLYTAVALVGLVLSFLCWQLAGHFMPLVDTARGSFSLALPLILGALAGVLCERSGVVNVAIEGQFLMGAFGGALVATMATSVWAGLVGAAIGGLLIAALLAVFAIRYLVDQVVLGVVLNLFALGLTGFLYERLMQHNPEGYNSPPRLSDWHIPLLDRIPLLGPVLFQQNVFGYVALILVVVITFALFYTRWGLRTRAVGEHPTAADTVGIRVLAMRYRNVLVAGLVAGLGGASFTLGLGHTFTKNITSGKGFIALAALIFGRWSPTGALLAALLFGFADKLQVNLSAIGSPIPSQFLNMLPYLATIFAVAGLVGRIRAPAADGKPYIKS
jgi:simple sugar transport system permease protein